LVYGFVDKILEYWEHRDDHPYICIVTIDTQATGEENGIEINDASASV
jgi:hypothetical protein